jgi:hypothetical protein
MSSIRVVLKPSADGSLHLPLPEALRGETSLRVVAWIEPETVVARGKIGAGAWAVRARGLAVPPACETGDDARFAALKRKFITSD